MGLLSKFSEFNKGAGLCLCSAIVLLLDDWYLVFLLNIYAGLVSGSSSNLDGNYL